MKKNRIVFFITIFLYISSLLAEDDSLYDNMMSKLTQISENGIINRVLVIPHPWAAPPEKSSSTSASKHLEFKLKSNPNLIVKNNDIVLQKLDEIYKNSKNQLSSKTMELITEGVPVDILLFCKKTDEDGRSKLTVNVVKAKNGEVILTAMVWKKKDSENKSKKQYSDTPRESDRVPSNYSISALKFTKSGSNTLNISGTIRNGSNTIFKRPALTIYLLDAAGKRIASLKASADRDIFQGETLPFRGIIKKPAVAYSSSRIKYYPVEKEKTMFTRKLSLKEKRLVTDGKKYIKVYGTITNSHYENIYFPSVIVSFYNKDENFIGSARGFAEIRNLPPGKSSRFRVYINRKILGENPVSCRFHFSGRVAP